MCVMCPQLIGMLDEVLNCSQCVFQPVSRLSAVGFIQAAFHLILRAGFFFLFCFFYLLSFLPGCLKNLLALLKLNPMIQSPPPEKKEQKQPRNCASQELERVEKVQI